MLYIVIDWFKDLYETQKALNFIMIVTLSITCIVVFFITIGVAEIIRSWFKTKEFKYKALDNINLSTEEKTSLYNKLFHQFNMQVNLSQSDAYHLAILLVDIINKNKLESIPHYLRDIRHALDDASLEILKDILDTTKQKDSE